MQNYVWRISDGLHGSIYVPHIIFSLFYKREKLQKDFVLIALAICLFSMITHAVCLFSVKAHAICLFSMIQHTVYLFFMIAHAICLSSTIAHATSFFCRDTTCLFFCDSTCYLSFFRDCIYIAVLLL